MNFLTPKQNTKINPSNNDHQSFQMPKGHENYSEKDKEQCPFLQIKEQQKAKENGGQQLGSNTKEKSKKPKQKKMRSGCPFLPSERKKNPSLMAEIPEGFNLEYISKFNCLLSQRADQQHYGKHNPTRLIFDQYPIYLKHTLFHNDEEMQKLRKFEMANQFLVFDSLRESANKMFNQQKYSESIALNERALSCFRWLELKDEDSQEDNLLDSSFLSEENLSQKSANCRLNMNKKEEEEESEEVKKAREEERAFRKKCSYYLTFYNDKNVVYHDVDNLEEPSDADMVRSMLLQIYINMAVTYMKIQHFELAFIALQDASKINDRNSQIYFRKAQALAYNNCSSIQTLEKAKQFITQALEMRHYEKIYQAGIGILKALNLENSEEAYTNLARYIQTKIETIEKQDLQEMRKMVAEVKQIELYEQELIDQGKLPISGFTSETCEFSAYMDMDNNEYEIADEIIARYLRIIEFYQENQQPDFVVNAKKELQYAKSIYQKMTFYKYLDLRFYPQQKIVKELLSEIKIDITTEKFHRRFNRIKLNKMKELFENAS